MKFLIILWVGFIPFCVAAQQPLPVTQFDAPGNKPFILMLSGDGGVKGFTLSMARAIQSRGYTIALVDAHAYFWSKKSPEETTSAVASFMQKVLTANANRQWVMVGYSFGGDVTPFVVNRLPDSVKSHLLKTILLSPSTSTDFEIHLSDMLGIGKTRDHDVVQEINRMGNMDVTMFGGDDEANFPLDKIRLAHFSHELIRGNHHFDGNYNLVADKICQSISTAK